MNPHRLKAYLQLFWVSVIWGIASPVIKLLLGEIPPLPFLALRFLISGIFSLVMLLIFKPKIPKTPALLLLLFIFGFFNSTVALGLFFLGLDKTTVLDSSVLTLVGPILISIAGVIYLKEHVTSREKLGLFLTVIGTVFTLVEPLLEPGSKTMAFSGNLFILLYLLANTIAVLLSKKLLKNNVEPAALTDFSFIIGALTTIPIWLATSAHPLSTVTSISLPGWLGILFMALFSGNLAYGLAHKAQKSIEVGEASVFSYLSPVFSAPLAIIFLNEKPTPLFIVGTLIVLTGVSMAEVKEKRSK